MIDPDELLPDAEHPTSCAADYGDFRCCFPNCLCPRSPSPTVAAELVAWRNRVEFLKVDGTWRDDVGIDAVLDEFLSAIESLYASPPVRKDQEAITRGTDPELVSVLPTNKEP